LIFDGSESVFGVVVGSTNQIQELAMQFGRGGSNNFEIGEQSVVGELLGNFAEQETLAVVLDMMDGESSHNHIERPQRRQGIIQVPLPNADSIVAHESTVGMPKHGRRRIHGHDLLDAWAMLENEGCQPAVATPQVKH
jgi:hypothetical protein